MTGLAIFYLICFVVGVTLTVLAFLGGGWHVPHVNVHTPTIHVHTPHVHVPLPHGGHLATPQAAGAPHAGPAQSAEMPFINFGTISAFLVWFGGAGYLLTRYSTWVVSVILLVAVVIGLVGANIIFWFVAKLLMKHDRELDPADYERVGVLGRISSPVRAGGTGEIIFSQEGTRMTCGARSEAGEALERGTEVIITRYEKGIAYVRRWEEMAERQQSATSN
jgi:membrane protein implicated in regulation of membrane protease activity